MADSSTLTEHRFISFDKTPLYYRRYSTGTPARGVVIVVHGIGEHGGRYEALASYLSGLGIESFLPDLRGFGKSGSRRACIRRFSDFHRDLFALHALIKRTSGLPVFMLGHSLGGLVVSSYAAFSEHPALEGVILSSPSFGLSLRVPAWRHAGGLFLSYWLPDLTQPTFVVAEMLTHNPAVIARYEKDALIYRRISMRLYREMTTMMSRSMEIAKSIKISVLLMQAGDDQVVSKEDSLRFYHALASQDKEIEVYDGYYHEILNETNQLAVFTRLGEWIVKHLNG